MNGRDIRFEKWITFWNTTENWININYLRASWTNNARPFMQIVSIWISSEKNHSNTEKNGTDHGTATRGEMDNWLLAHKKKCDEKNNFHILPNSWFIVSHLFFLASATFFITEPEALARSYLKFHLACDHLWTLLHMKLENFPHHFSQYALMFSIRDKKNTIENI